VALIRYYTRHLRKLGPAGAPCCGFHLQIALDRRYKKADRVT
jgi:hypothetical protein